MFPNRRLQGRFWLDMGPGSSSCGSALQTSGTTTPNHKLQGAPMAELPELHLIVIWFCDCIAQVCPKYVQPHIVHVGYSMADSRDHLGSSASLLVGAVY